VAERSVIPIDWRVHLDVVDGVLFAHITPPRPADGNEYAFYLQRNGKRVESRWYTNEPFARFDTGADEGRFRAIGFVRRPGRGEPEMAQSTAIRRLPTAQSGDRLAGVPLCRVDLADLAGVLCTSGRQRLDVDVPGLPFHYSCLLTRQPGDRLFVILGGAVPDRHQTLLPRFFRFTWASDFPGPVLCIADPTLQLDERIRLGWYFGRSDANATKGLVEVVQTFTAALGLRCDQIIAYGSSGGGFAAMQLAARIGDGATAVAINAQSDVLRFAQENAVEQFLSVCTGGMNLETARNVFGDRLLLESAWNIPSARRARCLLVQNRRDHHHFDEHLRPFASAFGLPVPGTSADGRMATMLYHFPNGHGAEPRSMLPQILQKATALRIPQPTHSAPMNFIDKVATIKPKADFLALTYISLRNRYVYLAVGKAANSTVKHHLYELEYSGTRFKTKSVHDRQSAPLLSPFQLPDDLLEEVFTGPKYFRFSVVRNPYSRLLSCYLDRIVPGSGAAYRQLIRVLGRPEGSTVSFPEFIRTACSQTPFAQNNHWRLQVAEICADVIPYDFIGKQETFAADMSEIWKHVAPNYPMPEFARANKSPSITGAKSRLNEYYTPELVDLVRTAYMPDFERFGYPLELA
jgi:pimeloyl-ACP methyl ester carboxylesterase